MADYYPLIARAISGLDPSAPGEQRRAIYERARAALIAQLRGVQPPLTESEITRERLALEEAVRKVESEAAQRSRDASRAELKNRRPAGEAARPGDALRASSRAPSRPGDPPPQVSRAPLPPGAAQAEPESPVRPRSQSPAPPPPREDRPQRNLRVDPPPIPPEPGRERPAVRRPDQGQGAGQGPGAGQGANPAADNGLRGFRDVTADLDDIGRAAAQANRSARKTYANVAPSPEFDRLEPSMENRTDPGAPYSYDESIDEASRYAPQPATTRPRIEPDRKASRKPTRKPSRFPLRSALVIGLVLVLVGAGILWGPSLWSAMRGLMKSQPSTETATTTAPPASTERPKITDRVGQPSSSEMVAPVAQRVVLYDEDPSDPKGKQYVGTVVWRTEQIKGASAKGGADLAVRADIEVPERKFKMTMSFRRNTDTSLPASHTAELTFILPQDFTGGGVANVPGILMKSNEQARGTPLAGLAVKVTDGFFLVGLSNVEADRARNLQLLKERSWFDVPIVYTNQRRAIIAIEKGPPGERAFSEAFGAWGE
ncbi:hypothetical protein [Rhodopseudomonas pseudopalustris]|uniref:Uncharacterized protein n=1 Tax=Rhodopseudomonas pseudopalustris TaxID=1513892 RepID=A0A1H8WQU9_9BRAD|nr:hypothetical protein [Rhodopseudomonas pseudopalustris]SEP30094.1 hypothetical protein SAMN05444123_113108 [Rhodopseudomonas pseudopalustris]